MPTIPVSRPPQVPTLKRNLARAILKLSGWKIEITPSIVHAYPKYIIIAAPHTSNWDAIFGGLGFMAADIGTSIIIKQEWIKTPVIGWILSAFGCVGINRDGSLNTVQQITRIFAEKSQFVLVITPEGTRKKVPFWKSGFYYIAQQAGVPLMLGIPDYGRKVCTIAPTVVFPTGDIDADMKQFQEALDAVTPRYPEKKSEMVFKIK